MTEEEMEGPTSSWRIKEQKTRLTLQEHDDDEWYFWNFIVLLWFHVIILLFTTSAQQLKNTSHITLKNTSLNKK